MFWWLFATSVLSWWLHGSSEERPCSSYMLNLCECSQFVWYLRVAGLRISTPKWPEILNAPFPAVGLPSLLVLLPLLCRSLFQDTHLPNSPNRWFLIHLKMVNYSESVSIRSWLDCVIISPVQGQGCWPPSGERKHPWSWFQSACSPERSSVPVVFSFGGGWWPKHFKSGLKWNLESWLFFFLSAHCCSSWFPLRSRCHGG